MNDLIGPPIGKHLPQRYAAAQLLPETIPRYLLDFL